MLNETDGTKRKKQNDSCCCKVSKRRVTRTLQQVNITSLVYKNRIAAMVIVISLEREYRLESAQRQTSIIF